MRLLGRTRRRLLAVGLLACVATLGNGMPLVAATDRLTVESREIARFEIGSDRRRFGDLEFRGGFSYRSSNRDLASISSIRMRDGGRRFLAVADTGLWFAGQIRRDAAGRPIGIDEARLAPILDPLGRTYGRKSDVDAEGLALRGTRALVSFEGKHRIASYALDGPDALPFGSRPEPVPMPLTRRELRSNGGIETIAVAPRRGPLSGETVVVAERSIDDEGNLYGAILGRGAKGLFSVRREDPWAITDGAFTADGTHLMLLERRYEGFGRIGMRIRKIAAADIRQGAVVDGPVLIDADLGDEIDNMEGLDLWQDAAGDTILSIVSDDNGSFFQRNLYLEFRLVPGNEGASAPSN